MMRLAEMNRHIAQRHGQGVPHNMGIKTKEQLDMAGHEMKESPPKILAHTKVKFGKARAEKQGEAILLSKARKGGAKIPLKKS